MDKADKAMETGRKRPSLHRGVWPAIALVMAFACFAGASRAVYEALYHTNLDLLLSAIGDGFVPWMLVSYGLIGCTAGLTVWALGRDQRRSLNDLLSSPKTKPAERVGGTGPRASGGTP